MRNLQVWKLLRELAAHFPDSYMHLGGDEVPLGCWEVSELIDKQCMTAHEVRWTPRSYPGCSVSAATEGRA